MNQEQIVAAQKEAYLQSISPVSRIPDWNLKTPQEITDFCENNHQTVNQINAQELRNWLADNRIAWPSLSGGWAGPLPTLVAPLAASDDEDLIALSRGIERLLGHLASPGAVQVDSHLDSYSPLLAGLITALELPDDLVQSLYALGGGRKYPRLSIAQATEMQAALKHAMRVVNSLALFGERMQIGNDPAEVMANSWEDAAI